jgi:ribosomal protein L40E
MDRTDLYLQWNVGKRYENTIKENEMVQKVSALFAIASGYQKGIEYVSPQNLAKWRKAYLGTLNALDKNTGEESKRKSKQLRKAIYELIESKVDNNVPLPKMLPRKKKDLAVVEITENYLKFEMDRMLSEQENDKSERATYIDGTSWYKVCWDSLDNNYERSGDVRIEVLLADQVIPEPGITNYRLMNYCFEKKKMSLSRIYDLYGRLIIPVEDGNSTCDVVTYYYKNEDGIVGRFMYASNSLQVINWEKEWQVRKVRVCMACGTINPIGDTCRNCGGTRFKYINQEKEILDENIEYMSNPYEDGESDNPEDTSKVNVLAEAGDEIPLYKITQLPFVPRPSVSSIDTIYGISEVGILLDMQDSINKILTKVEDKILKSGTIVTKPERAKINSSDDTFKIIGVKSAEEAAQYSSREVIANVAQDISVAQLFYESMRSSSGVTESYQGKVDNTATSGKAKEISALQSAGRIESLRVMKAAAFAGVYELILKYLLAFSDETREFVAILPNGQRKEMIWNKYMFLRKDKYGNLYYADDFAFSTDAAATLSNNRVQMWQETQAQFVQGTMGNPADPRTLELYWRIMEANQYPLSRVVLTGIEENSQHLPAELEQAILQNPQLLNTVKEVIAAQGEQRGGARPNSGPQGNGATHTANVDRTNLRNKIEAGNNITGGQGALTGGNV